MRISLDSGSRRPHQRKELGPMGRAGAHERRQRLCRLGAHGSILGGLLQLLSPACCTYYLLVIVVLELEWPREKLAACSIQDTPCS